MTTMNEREALDQYNDMLDEVYDTVNIGNLSYTASQVLSQVDPVAYRTGFNDWLDSEGIELDD